MQLAHWKIERDQKNILWAYLDRAGEAVNSLTRDILSELDQIIDTVRHDKTTKALVIASAKSSGFIFGADITQFVDGSNVDEALALIQAGQKTFKHLAALKCPTIAMISGVCLGGGLELALACRYRIALDDPKTKLGLPEIKLGIQPGWGGSVRLPALIGAPQAMDLILTGRTVVAYKAKQMGIVDECVPERQFRRAVVDYAENPPKPHEATFFQALTNTYLARVLLAMQMKKKVAEKINPEHYPAPFAVIENFQRDGIHSDLALTHEADSISRLVQTDTAKNLIRVFLLQTKLKSLGKVSNFKAKHVHVIGAGTMGGDIASWCALSGLTVTLQDREPKFIAPAIKRAYSLFEKKLKLPRLVQAAMDRLMPDVDGLGIAKADVIIEAIYENTEAKQSLFKHLETHAKPNAILATNTSSIPLDQINTVLKNPERLVGIHFFNPVSMMTLVEVVRGQKTDESVFNDAMAFVRQIDRLPLPVKSSPGFLVNRVLMPYLMECVNLIEEGFSKEAIDDAAVKFGMPMGPVELSDTVGLDVCLSVAENLTKAFGGTVPQKLKDMVETKKLGKKTGAGFYRYQNGKILREKYEMDPAKQKLITDRLILRMINEAVTCLREQVVTDPDLVDAGMIFGTGFAPFRGGPLHYAKAHGVMKIVEDLAALQKQFGERFKADTAWNSLNVS